MENVQNGSHSILPAALHSDPRAQAVATTRYIDLVQGIGAELKHATGWRGEAAKRVGISSSLLSQILNGRKVTTGTLEKAIFALHLPHDYFGSPSEVRTIPRSDMPPAPTPVDPLLVLEAFKALPKDTRRRLLALIQSSELWT